MTGENTQSGRLHKQVLDFPCRALLTFTGSMGGTGVSGVASSPFHPPDPLSFQVCSTSLISQPSKTSRNHCLKVERPAFPRSWCQGMEKGVGRLPPPTFQGSVPAGPVHSAQTNSTVDLPSSLPCAEGLSSTAVPGGCAHQVGGAEEDNALAPLIPPLHLYNRTTSLQKRKPRGKMTHPRSYKIQAAKPGHKSKSDSRLATSPLSDQV